MAEIGLILQHRQKLKSCSKEKQNFMLKLSDYFFSANNWIKEIKSVWWKCFKTGLDSRSIYFLMDSAHFDLKESKIYEIDHGKMSSGDY